MLCRGAMLFVPSKRSPYHSSVSLICFGGLSHAILAADKAT